MIKIVYTQELVKIYDGQKLVTQGDSLQHHVLAKNVIYKLCELGYKRELLGNSKESIIAFEDV